MSIWSRSKLHWVIGTFILLGFALGPWTVASSAAPPGRSPLDWPQFHLTPDHRGFNPVESIISPSTVGGLTEKWSFQPTPFADLQNPVLVGGVIYFCSRHATPSTFNSVFAVDAGPEAQGPMGALPVAGRRSEPSDGQPRPGRDYLQRRSGDRKADH